MAEPHLPDFQALSLDLQQYLHRHGMLAQVTVYGNEILIQLGAQPTPTMAQVVPQIHTLLKNHPGFAQFPELQTVRIAAYRASAKAVWSKTLPLDLSQSAQEFHNFLSFKSHLNQLVLFPILLTLAMIMNLMPIVKFLLRGVTIWFHEFGHATIAWLAGRKAIPLPFGWTNVEPERSGLVYFGILVLLGLLAWAGHREQKRWPVLLAGGLAFLQVFMTWWMPTDTFEMLLAFGGIGGEFYLCTLLILSYYFALPAYFRWDFYRYPVVVGAAFTFWGAVAQWHQIDRGAESIPWGSLWGGAEHLGGDMNILSLQFHWSDSQIIQTYNGISGLCLTAIAAVYLYYVLRRWRVPLEIFWLQCVASFWER